MSYVIDERNPERQHLLAAVLTAEATGPLAQAKGVLTPDEVREMIAGLTQLEEDPSAVLMKFPDMWAIARR